MMDFIVDSIAERFDRMIIDRCFLTTSLRREVQAHQTCLRRMKWLLNNAVEKESIQEEVPEFVEEILEITDEAEDIADQINVVVFKSRLFDWKRGRIIYWSWNKLEQFVAESLMANKVATLTARGWDLCRRLEFYGLSQNVTVAKSDELLNASALWVTNLKLVSPMLEQFRREMEEEKAKLVSALVIGELAVNFRYIAIYGMSGIRNSVLAKKVYEDDEVRQYFEGFAMAFVGRNFRLRKILQDVLLQLTLAQSTEVFMLFSDLNLVQLLYESLQSKKYLIVLDDIDRDAWECLRIAIPSQKTHSRVFITTRHSEVAEKISAEKGIVHQTSLSVDGEVWRITGATHESSVASQ